MVVYRKSEVSRDNRKTGGPDIPNLPREFHCADNAMGSDKICAKKQVSDSGPQDFEGGLPSNVFPSDAMYGGEEEGTSRRADQVIFPLHDCRARNANQTDCASAIGAVVGRLEIDRDERQGVL
jgi:hypothetical protein